MRYFFSRSKFAKTCGAVDAGVGGSRRQTKFTEAVRHRWLDDLSPVDVFRSKVLPSTKNARVEPRRSLFRGMAGWLVGSGAREG